MTGKPDYNKILVDVWGLCLICVCIYLLLSPPRPTSSDFVPNALLPDVMLNEHTLYLDAYKPLYDNNFSTWNCFAGIRGDGHEYSGYPLITSILATPFYIFRQLSDPGLHSTIENLTMGYTAAIAFTLITGLLLYFAITLLFGRRSALVATIIFWFATSAWCINSAGLWTHTVSCMLYAAMLLLVILDMQDRGLYWCNWRILIMVLAALYVFNRPVVFYLAVPFILYALFYRGRIPAAIAGIIVGTPFAIYNWLVFGSKGTLGLYGTPTDLAAASVRSPPGGLLYNSLTNLFSPSKGVFAESPILLLALPGVWCIQKLGDKRLRVLFYLIAGTCIAHFYLYAGVVHPGCDGLGFYGQRYFADAVPALVVLSMIFIKDYLSPSSTTKKLVMALIIVLFLASLFGQLVGVFCYTYIPCQWEADAQVNHDLYWSITDSQPARSIQAYCNKTWGGG